MTYYNDLWDEPFILKFEDGTGRRIDAKFLEGAARDKRTGEMMARFKQQAATGYKHPGEPAMILKRRKRKRKRSY